MMLSEEQKNHLIKKVNEKVNLPILGEKGEKKLIGRAIDRVIEKLEKELPENKINSIDDVADGFVLGGEGDMQDAIKATVDFLNKEINPPLINEEKGEKFFTTLVELLFDAMTQGKKLEVQ